MFHPPIFALASLLAAVVLLAGCEGSAPYRIGVVLDADGLRAATLATEQINANGGINGHPLELRYIGGAGSTKAKLALETAEHLAADPSILAVVGHTNSGASIAASQVYNARRIAQIAPSGGAEARDIMLRERVDLVVSDLRMPGEMDGYALIEWMQRERPALAESALLATGDVSGAASVAFPVPVERLLKKPFEGAEFVRRVRAALVAVELGLLPVADRS